MKYFLLALLLAVTSCQASTDETLGYRVLGKKPQSRAHFVQGLQIIDGELWLSTGQYGESRLLRYRLADGELLAERRLSPRLFGEGLTVVGDRIYQLTWRARLLLVWDRNSLRIVKTIALPGQGWGITWNGSELIYSDGSDRLFFMDPGSGKIVRSIQVKDGNEPVFRLNELEWIDGRIWANVWQTDKLVIINPTSGEVSQRVDLSGLLPASEHSASTDVLNGIARDPDSGALWVTGKRWPWMYQIELLSAPNATRNASPNATLNAIPTTGTTAEPR